MIFLVNSVSAQETESYEFTEEMVTRDISDVAEIEVLIEGAGGGYGNGTSGGSGGYLETRLDVSDMENLEIWVGEGGEEEGDGGWGRHDGGHAERWSGSGGGSTELTADGEEFFLAAADAGGGGARDHHNYEGAGGGARGGQGSLDGGDAEGEGYGGDGGGEGEEGEDGGQEVNEDYLIEMISSYEGGGSGSEEDGYIEITYHYETSVETEHATDLDIDKATLVGEVVELYGDSVDVLFEYRELGTEEWSETDTETMEETGSFEREIDGLIPGTAYEFRAIGICGSELLGEKTGVIETFETDEVTDPDVDLQDPVDDANFDFYDDVTYEFDVQTFDEEVNVTLFVDGESIEEWEQTAETSETYTYTEQDKLDGDYDWYVEVDGEHSFTESDVRSYTVGEPDVDITLVDPDDEELFDPGTEEVEMRWEIDTDVSGDTQLYVNDSEEYTEVVDTTSDTVLIEHNFSVGTGVVYEWYVGFDSDYGHQEDSVKRIFEVEEGDISQELIEPEDSSKFSEADIHFEWQVTANEDYETELYLNGESEVLQMDSGDGTANVHNYTKTLTDGEYEWYVRTTGIETGESYSTATYDFYIDTDPPLYWWHSGDDSSGIVDSGEEVNVSVYWNNSVTSLDTGELYHNASGVMEADETKKFDDVKSSWFNASIDTSEVVDETVCWRQEANDSAGNLNDSMSLSCFDVVEKPVVETDETTDVTLDTAVLHGELIETGSYDEVEVYFEYRNDADDEWIETEKQELSVVDEFDATISDLEGGTFYEYRAVVEANGAVSYGNITTFSTKNLEVITDGTSEVGIDSATIHGSLTQMDSYDEVEVYFEYKNRDAEEWEETSRETLTRTSDFSEELVDLDTGYTYEFRAVAESEGDKVRGNTLSFRTVDWFLSEPYSLENESWIESSTSTENLMQTYENDLIARTGQLGVIDNVHLRDGFDPWSIDRIQEGGNVEWTVGEQYEEGGSIEAHTDSGQIEELYIEQEFLPLNPEDIDGDLEFTGAHMIEIADRDPDEVTIAYSIRDEGEWIEIYDDIYDGETDWTEVVENYNPQGEVDALRAHIYIDPDDHGTQSDDVYFYADAMDLEGDFVAEQGERVSEPYHQEIDRVGRNNITWDSTEPEGTDLEVYTAVTDTDEEPDPGEWEEATNGEPFIEEGTELVDRYIWTRQVLHAGSTPELHSIDYSIEEMDGELSVELNEPSESTLAPHNRNFTMNATVECTEVDCGDIDITARYNDTDNEPDTAISDSGGDEPFYIHDYNPKSCELLEGESCNVEWKVNSTGELGEVYEIDVHAEAGDENHSDRVDVEIGKVLVYDLTFESVDFGTIDPGGSGEASDNDINGYNISIDPNSNDLEELWIKGTDLVTDPLSDYSIGISNVSWSFSNNEIREPITDTYSLMGEDFASGQNITTYYWIDVPYSLVDETFSGEINFKANATW